MSSISQPGVNVTQEFVSTSATVVSPNLESVIVGPCYHVLDAKNTTTNTFNENAKTSSGYTKTYGKQSFELPGLSSYSGAIVDSSSVEVYMNKAGTGGVPGSALRSADGDTVISSTSGVIVANNDTPTFTDTAVSDWTAEGLTARSSTTRGDVVRLDYQGASYDLEITAIAVGQLTLDVGRLSDTGVATGSPLYNVGLSGQTYTIVKSPAEYVFHATAQHAKTRAFGSTTEHINFAALSTGSLAGAAAETAKHKIVLQSSYIAKGTDGYGDGSLLFDNSTTLANVTANMYLLWDAHTSTKVYDVQAIVEAPISAKAVGLSTNALNTKGSGKNAIIGAVSTTSFTIDFGSGNTAAGVTQFAGNGSVTGAIKVAGSWHALTAINNGNIALTGTTNSPLHNGGVVTVDAYINNAVYVATNSASEGSGKFGSPTLPASGITTSDKFCFGNVYSAIGGVALADKLLDISGISSAGGAESWTAITPSSPAANSIAISSGTYTINVKRAADGTLDTLDNIKKLITDSTATGYNATVAAAITVNKTGGSTTETLLDHEDLGTWYLEGGCDANQVILDAGLTTGNGTIPVYIGYRALRVDLSAAANDPKLQTIGSLSDITTYIGRYDTEKNPLGVAAYLALQNTTSQQSIKVLGVSAADYAEISTYPDGSPTAYEAALTMLESEEVYSLAPLSSHREVVSLFKAHCDTMSLAANRSERICFISRDYPSYSSATLLASGSAAVTSASFHTDSPAYVSTSVDFGTDGGNITGLNTTDMSAGNIVLVFDNYKASTANAATKLLGAPSVLYGLRVTGVLASDTFQLVVNDSDTTTTLQNFSGESWKLYKQGAAITAAADVATRVAAYGAEYATRRTFLVWPPKVIATVGGSLTELKGHYMASTISSMVGFKKIGQGFTNIVVKGFSDMRYSNRFFSKSQLDSIAGGGIFITEQPTKNGAIKVRHQLATDVSTVQKRELSVTKSLDYFSKTLRASLKNRIGTFNITSEFIQTISLTAQAIISNMVARGIVAGATLTKVEQDSTNVDTLNVNISVSPVFPCNYIDITLKI